MGTYQAHVEQSLGGTIRVLYAQQVVRDEHHLLQSVQGRVQGLPERDSNRVRRRKSKKESERQLEIAVYSCNLIKAQRKCGVI